MQNTTNHIKRELQLTADGSHTLFIPEMDEHYHSVNGAVQESRHVFIEAGLHHLERRKITILEIGFGTGLNAWLTLEEAEKSGRNVYYTGLELYPLEWQLVEQLGYISANEQLMTGDNQCPAHELFKQLHTSPWEEDVPITPHFTLRKVQKDFNKLETETEGWKADVIYFDAFAPEKQPEMWSQELFNRLYVLLNNGGILTTYCAKGVVRRMLQAAGFIVERLPGPPGGKREILRARKQE